MSNNGVKHILRYGTHAEKKFIDDKDVLYDLLAFNGNMVAYTPGAIAEFIMMNLLNSEDDKGFFIDPITHAFQHDLSKIKSYSKKEGKKTIKKSIQKLLEIYGKPVQSIILDEDKPVMPNHFSDVDQKESFCENVINFQLNTTSVKLKEKGFMDYITEDDPMLENLEPNFITPPYFYMTENTIDEWLDLNIEFLQITKSKFESKDIYAQIVISKDIFYSDDLLDKMCNRYIEENPTGILLWIDEFNEHEVSKSQLGKYLKIIKSFSEHDIKVMNLYGGFFSISLTGFKDELGYRLDGVGHGLEYGEYRSVVPVGGGIPTSKYYYFPLHDRLRFLEASELLEELGYLNPDSDPDEQEKQAQRYIEEICSCRRCQKIIGTNINNFHTFENTEFYEVTIRGVKQRRSYPNQETKEACLLHYLWNKNKEFEMVKKKSLNEIIKHIKDNYNEHSKMGVLHWEAITYLKNWYKILEEERRMI